MSIPSHQSEKIQRLFQKHVPQVATGVVEIVSISREPEKGLVVSVRSRESTVHPVSVISYHLKDISRELAQGRITVLLQNEQS